MTLAELGLTPSQLAELEALEPTLIDAWLEALRHAHGLRSPVGWFLAGVRSGTVPGAVSDNERVQAVRLAERYLATAGMFLPSEAELLDELFGERGRLKPWASDQALRIQMLERWRAAQPAADQVEREQLERAQRWKQARAPAPIPWP